MVIAERHSHKLIVRRDKLYYINHRTDTSTLAGAFILISAGFYIGLLLKVSSLEIQAGDVSAGFSSSLASDYRCGGHRTSLGAFSAAPGSVLHTYRSDYL